MVLLQLPDVAWQSRHHQLRAAPRSRLRRQDAAKRVDASHGLAERGNGPTKLHRVEALAPALQTHGKRRAGLDIAEVKKRSCTRWQCSPLPGRSGREQ